MHVCCSNKSTVDRLGLAANDLGGDAQHLLQDLRGRRVVVAALEGVDLLPVGGHHQQGVVGIVLLGLALADEYIDY